MGEKPTEGATHLIDHRAALPADVISAWFNGDYLIGDRNTNQVKYLGFCLALLGTYRYFTLESLEDSGKRTFRIAHYGFCRIELIDQELEFHGIRLYTNPYTWRAEKAKDHLPLWRSEFSKIWDDGISQNLLFAYSLKEEPSDAEFRSKMLPIVDPLQHAIQDLATPIAEAGVLELIDKLKRLPCSDECVRLVENRLSAPEWNSAWVDRMKPDDLGSLFAFLRFPKLGEALTSGKLMAEYRSLAPSEVAGVNCFW